MKVEYSPRVEAELVRLFRDSAERFGVAVANRTLGKVKRTFESTLTDYPFIGQSLRSRNLYRLPIPGTPFVAYY